MEILRGKWKAVALATLVAGCGGGLVTGGLVVDKTYAPETTTTQYIYQDFGGVGTYIQRENIDPESWDISFQDCKTNNYCIIKEAPVSEEFFNTVKIGNTVDCSLECVIVDFSIRSQ